MRVFFYSWVCLICLVFASSALAEMSPEETKKQLSIQVFASKEDPVKMWFETKPPAPPHFSKLKEVSIAESFHVAMLVGGLSLDKDRGYKGTVGIKILKPDGTTLLEEKDYSVISGIAPDKYNGYLAAFKMVDPAILMMMEASDTKGTYTIKAVLRDDNNNNEAEGSHIFVLI